MGQWCGGQWSLLAGKMCERSKAAIITVEAGIARGKSRMKTFLLEPAHETIRVRTEGRFESQRGLPTKFHLPQAKDSWTGTKCERASFTMESGWVSHWS